MLHLQSMTEDEFIAFKSWMIADYANDLANNYRLPIDEARASSAKEIEGMLSQGLSTPGQFLYNIILSTQGGESRIGHFWIAVDDQKKRCFIADIYLHPEFRHQGWGRKTLELLEANMKQQGIARISLHVFANNRVAQDLYRKMGYQPTGVNMQKWLID